MTIIERAIVMAIPLFVPVVVFAVACYAPRVMHALCCALAFVLRMCGRYVHVGDKKPGHCAEPCLHDACATARLTNPEGRYIDRYALIGGACTNEGVRGWLAKRLGVNVWLQRIWRPDADRNMHDHPWHNAGSIVLCGGYSEDRPGDSRSTLLGSNNEPLQWRDVFAGSVNLLPRGVYHRISYVEPYTWTLFVTSRPHGAGWGFLEDGEHVDHEEYFAREKEAAGWLSDTAREYTPIKVSGPGPAEFLTEFDTLPRCPHYAMNANAGDGDEDAGRCVRKLGHPGEHCYLVAECEQVTGGREFEGFDPADPTLGLVHPDPLILDAPDTLRSVPSTIIPPAKEES